MNKPTVCRYCGGNVILCDSSAIYGVSYGNIYLCTSCRAYVGVHKGTVKPYGTLADAPLRRKRKETHNVFDAWWKAQGISRTYAYRWLSQQLGLSFGETHIGYFDTDVCDQIIELCRTQTYEEAV